MIAIFAVIYFLFLISKMFTTISRDKVTWSKTSIPAYDSLFSTATQKELHVLSTVKSKLREPESSYFLESGFNIFVYRVTFKDENFNHNFIKISKGLSDNKNSEVYSELPSSGFEMFKKEGKIDSITNVNIKYYGDDFKILKKDSSTLCYYVLFRSLSISFDEEPFDIVANANKSISANLAFIKQGQFLYIILMTPSNDNKVKSDQLYKILSPTLTQASRLW